MSRQKITLSELRCNPFAAPSVSSRGELVATEEQLVALVSDPELRR